MDDLSDSVSPRGSVCEDSHAAATWLSGNAQMSSLKLPVEKPDWWVFDPLSLFESEIYVTDAPDFPTSLSWNSHQKLRFPSHLWSPDGMMGTKIRIVHAWSVKTKDKPTILELIPSIYLLVLSREWMGMGGNGMIITSDYESFPHSLLSTSRFTMILGMVYGIQFATFMFFYATVFLDKRNEENSSKRRPTPTLL